MSGTTEELVALLAPFTGVGVEVGRRCSGDGGGRGCINWAATWSGTDRGIPGVFCRPIRHTTKANAIDTALFGFMLMLFEKHSDCDLKHKLVG